MERLFDLIYGTVADPSIWLEVTSALAREVGATAAWMGQLGRIDPIFFARDGLSGAAIKEYADHYAPIDLLVQEWRRRPGEMENRVIHLFEYVDEQAWLGSEIYNDYCLKTGIGDVLTASLSPGAEGHEARFITFFHPPGHVFDEPAIRLYGLLLPHLRRAIRLRQAVSSQHDSVPIWTAALLEQLPSGVFLLDRSGRLIHSNAVGHAILAARDGLLLKAGGRPAATERSASRLLEGALNACLAAQPRGTEMVVPRAAGGVWLLSACPISEFPRQRLGKRRAGPGCAYPTRRQSTGTSPPASVLFSVSPRQSNGSRSRRGKGGRRRRSPSRTPSPWPPSGARFKHYTRSWAFVGRRNWFVSSVRAPCCRAPRTDNLPHHQS